MLIEIRNYSKTLKNKKVLDGINYIFESGKIYGLYGRNGSGKTMLMRAITGLIHSTEGEILIDGKILHKDISIPPDMGVIIENMEMMPDYDGFTNLKLLSKIRKKVTDDDIRKALELVGLGNVDTATPKNVFQKVMIWLGVRKYDKKVVKEYSLGMKQKLSIAQAIFEKPKLLILDEPTNALDQKSVERVREVLIEMKKQGTLIIIASHNKEDIQMLSDVIIHMDEGRLKVCSNIDEIGEDVVYSMS